MDPKALLASADILVQIKALCYKQLRDANLADECYLFVLDGLEADDYARLRAFRGQSAEKTFVYSLAASLAIDFKRSRFGRKRIPKAVAELGAWAEEVYKLICWQAHSLRDAFELVSLRGLYAKTRDAFLAEAAPIRDAPCSRNSVSKSLDDEHSGLAATLATQDPNPLESLFARLDHEQRVRAATALRSVIVGLSEADKTLVRLVYGEDQSVAKVGRALGVSATAAHKRLAKLLTACKAALLKVGVREL